MLPQSNANAKLGELLLRRWADINLDYYVRIITEAGTNAITESELLLRTMFCRRRRRRRRLLLLSAR